MWPSDLCVDFVCPPVYWWFAVDVPTFAMIALQYPFPHCSDAAPCFSAGGTRRLARLVMANKTRLGWLVSLRSLERECGWLSCGLVVYLSMGYPLCEYEV